MRNKGFTLIELLIVIVVVAVLGTAVVVAINPIAKINSANRAKVETFGASLQNNLSINLVGEWTFDDGTARDTSGYGNNGAVTGATLTADRRGQANKAYDFNGATSNILVADSNSLDITGAITLEAWVNNVNTGAALDGGIVWKSTAIYGGAVNLTYELGFLDGSLYFQIGNGANTESVSYPWAEGSSSWHHIAATWDGTTSVTAMKIYVNGVSKSIADSNTVASIRVTADPVKIGGATANPAYAFFKGSLDDVRIYNQTFSLSQIQQLYARGLVRRYMAYK
jgi:prepilin-type N-terminal cleavage/methylation domain-containing protein